MLAILLSTGHFLVIGPSRAFRIHEFCRSSTERAGGPSPEPYRKKIQQPTGPRLRRARSIEYGTSTASAHVYARFKVADASGDKEHNFDLIAFFDCLHDMADPSA
jgi:hypothetical protein